MFWSHMDYSVLCVCFHSFCNCFLSNAEFIHLRCFCQKTNFHSSPKIFFLMFSLGSHYDSQHPAVSHLHYAFTSNKSQCGLFWLACRWLDTGVDNLTCTQYWVTYLRVLQEAIWPGGNLPALPRPHRSPQQKDESRKQAQHCLMKLLPGRSPNNTHAHAWTCCYTCKNLSDLNRKLCIICIT